MRAHTASALKNSDNFEIEMVAAVERKRKSARANKWAARIAEIKNACNKRTDEEIKLYECAALTSWEAR